MNDENRLLRVRDIVKPSGLLPISVATWWRGVHQGKFPQPVQSRILGSRITVWRLSDINLLIKEINGSDK